MAAEMNDMLVEATLDKPELLAMIAAAAPAAVQEGDWLRFPKHSLRLTVAFGMMRRSEQLYSVQVLFIAQHPWFDEDLVEPFEGIAPSPDKAMEIAVRRYCEAVLTPLLGAFDENGTEILEADVRGSRHVFTVPASRPAAHWGTGTPTDLYALVREELPRYLGTKHCYWVDLTTVTAGGAPTCEVRINGSPFHRITERLYQEAFARKPVDGLVTDRQFLLFIQKEETRRPCPFTKQDVGELTHRALNLFQTIHDEASGRQAAQAIHDAAPSHSLGIEAAAFIPEIVAQQVVQFRDNDGLMPVVNRGKPDCELMKSQVRSYGYMEDAVFQYLSKAAPSDDEIKQLLAISGKFHVLTDAIEGGMPVEDFRMSQLVYFVDEDYVVW